MSMPSPADPIAARTSPLNFIEGIQRDLGLIRICDVTLRDGEQAVDAAFSSREKVAAAARLEDLGVHQLQVGYSKRDAETVRLIKQAGVKVPVELLCVCFNPTWKEDVKIAADAGVDVLNILLRSSDAQQEFLGVNRQQVEDRAAEAVQLAHDAGIGLVTFGPSFCTQANIEYLKQLCSTAVRAGAGRVNLADSMGVAKPAAIAFLVSEIASAIDVPIGIHCHNDFGLGVACTLAGLEAGATWADLSVNGIGERSGNASLEEVVLALRCLYGADLEIRLNRFCEVSAFFAGLLHSQLAGNKPVVGRNAFAQKLDIHVRVASQRPEIFEPYDPALVGNQRWIGLGKGSGPYAVKAKLAQMGWNVDDDGLALLVEWVNEKADRDKGYVKDTELVDFLQAETNAAKVTS